MNWLKKNPAQASLAVASLVMLGAAFSLYSNASSFSETFRDGERAPAENNKIPPTDIQIVADRMAALDKSAAWASKPGSLFVSQKYLIKDGKLVKPGAGGTPLHPPVPNDYIIKYGLDITAPNLLTEDMDKDGFDLLLEYAGTDGVQTTQPPEIERDSTDPTNAESHPPYHTRLFLIRINKTPFRLLFRAYDGDSTKCTIQINPLDRGNKTMFVDMGQTVPGTDWKFESFVLNDKGDRDLSVANMVNVKNGQKLALTYNVMGDSPESFAVFAYKWVAPGGQEMAPFAKRKDETFVLEPEPAKNYKVVEIREKEVDVLLPSGEKKTFPLTPTPPK